MNLPQDWTQCNLTDICSIRTGKYDANHAVENGNYRFYTCSTTYSLCNTKSFEGECIIVPGNGDIGQVYYYDGEFEAYQRTYILEKIYILPRYLYYHLFWNWRHINSDKQYGSTIRYVRIGNFEKYIVSLPPLPEQQRIVAKIDSLFSELDDGVALLKTIKAQLATYRQAVLKWAFEGKLINSSWKFGILENIVSEIKIGPFGTLLHKADYIDNGIPIINPKHMNNQKIIYDSHTTISKEKANELSTYKLQENDILLARRGEMGRTAPVTEKENGWLCGTGSMIIRLKRGNLNGLYSLFLSSEQVRKYLTNNCKGTTMDNLNETIVKKIPVPICPKPEQLAIVSAIESRLSVCDKLEQTIDQTLALSASLRQSILKKAFEGRLVPQDPNDEPAEKLLERIKAEKAALLAKQKQTRKRGRR
jgi:type I restriction enzyme S subunit